MAGGGLHGRLWVWGVGWPQSPPRVTAGAAAWRKCRQPEATPTPREEALPETAPGHDFSCQCPRGGLSHEGTQLQGHLAETQQPMVPTTSGTEAWILWAHMTAPMPQLQALGEAAGHWAEVCPHPE